jgi:alkanesulfonate monooxygenase SsuD/methylene tetrahydromethanopterin reductase-like flavin-dependent oxidoreductase (luciferase family)
VRLCSTRKESAAGRSGFYVRMSSSSIPGDPISIYVAGSGPKTLELAGEIGDGLLEYTLSHIQRGAERAGKRLEDIYVLVATAFHLTSRDAASGRTSGDF